MFEQFWDDRDFLLIEEFQDLPPDHALHLKKLLRLPDEVLAPMYEALQRWRVSPDVAANLEGLLTDGEIRETVPLLDACVSRRQISNSEPEDEGTFVTGIEDRYHDLLVGPCDATEVAAEADCPLVLEISVSGEDAFDCTYQEWGEHLRADVRKAARQDASPSPPAEATEKPPDVAEQLHQAKTTGLEDGTRIEARGDGWVVIDSFFSFLLDPDDASWVASEDNEDMSPAVFPTAEAAYRAWELADRVTKERSRRREKALKRLGRSTE